MRLAEAFRLPATPRLALVGAGGKTTALFRLAGELLEREGSERPVTVLLTTTTHLGAGQAGLADVHVTISQAEELAWLKERLPPGAVLVTGPPAESEAGRITGLNNSSLQRLYYLAEDKRLPLLLEADGSRLRPLKAPADHEPALPGFVDSVAVVAGLSGLGKPLGPDWVHRPERFAALSGRAPGERIGAEDLAAVLTHPNGGLKNIPPGARRIVLLNQADNDELRFEAESLASSLLQAYHSVVVARVGGYGEERPSSPSGVWPAAEPVYSVHEPVAGIILAAGEASRFGRPKQLLPWGGEPLVRRVVQIALEAGLAHVVVVTGAHADQVSPALEGVNAGIIFNPDWAQGQSTSLQAGLRALPAGTGAAVFLLADQPHVPVPLIRALVDLHSRTLSALVAPSVQGWRANPVLFDRTVFPALLALSGDSGGRQLFSDPQRYPVAWVPWEDPSLLLDIDTPADYDRLLGRVGDEG